MKRVIYLGLLLLFIYSINVIGQNGQYCSQAIETIEGENISQKDSIWFKFVSDREYKIEISSIGKTTFDTKVEIYKSCYSNSEEYNDNYNGTTQSYVKFTSQKNTTYYIKFSKKDIVMKTGEGFKWTFSKTAIIDGETCVRPYILTETIGEFSIPQSTEKWYKFKTNKETLLEITINATAYSFIHQAMSTCSRQIDYPNYFDSNRRTIYLNSSDSILLNFITYNENIQFKYKTSIPKAGCREKNPIVLNKSIKATNLFSISKELHYVFTPIVDKVIKFTGESRNRFYTDIRYRKDTLENTLYNLKSYDLNINTSDKIIFRKGIQYMFSFFGTENDTLKLSFEALKIESGEDFTNQKTANIGDNITSLKLNKIEWFEFTPELTGILTIKGNNTSPLNIKAYNFGDYKTVLLEANSDSNTKMKTNVFKGLPISIMLTSNTLSEVSLNLHIDKETAGSSRYKTIPLKIYPDTNKLVNGEIEAWYEYMAKTNVKLEFSENNNIEEIKIVNRKEESTKNTNGNRDKINVRIGDVLKCKFKIQNIATPIFFVAESEADIGHFPDSPHILNVIGDTTFQHFANTPQWFKLTTTKESKLKVKISTSNFHLNSYIYKNNITNLKSFSNYNVEFTLESEANINYFIKIENATDSIKFKIEEDNSAGQYENNPIVLTNIQDSIYEFKETTYYKYTAKKNGLFVFKDYTAAEYKYSKFSKYIREYKTIPLIKDQSMLMKVIHQWYFQPKWSAEIYHGSGFNDQSPTLANEGLNICNHPYSNTKQHFIFTMPRDGNLKISACGLTSIDTEVYLYQNSFLRGYNNNKCDKQSQIRNYYKKGDILKIVWNTSEAPAIYQWNLSIDTTLPIHGDNCTNPINCKTGKNELEFINGSERYHTYTADRDEKVMISTNSNININVFLNCDFTNRSLEGITENEKKTIYLKTGERVILKISNNDSIKGKSYELTTIESTDILNREYIYATNVEFNKKYNEIFEKSKLIKYYKFKPLDDGLIQLKFKNINATLLNNDLQPIKSKRYQEYEYDVTAQEQYYLKIAILGTENDWIINYASNSTAEILDFWISENDNVKFNGSNIEIKVAASTNLKFLRPNFKLNEGATANINGVNQYSSINLVDFSTEVKYIIKSQNGKTKEWTINVTKSETQSSETNVIDFSVKDTEAIITIKSDTIDITLPYKYISDSINVEYKTSSFSKLLIDNKTIKTLNLERTYKSICIAEDGSTRLWTIITKKESAPKGYKSSNAIGLTIPYVYEFENKTIWFTYTPSNSGYLVYSSQFHDSKIEIYTSIANVTNNIQRSYLSKEKEKSLIKLVKGNNYYVKINSLKPFLDFNLDHLYESKNLDFNDIRTDIPNSKVVRDNKNHTIDIEMPPKTDITNITLSFKVDNSTKVYVDNIAQESEKSSNNFTNPKVYKIIAENNDSIKWRVTIIKRAVKTESNILLYGLMDQIGKTEIDNTVKTIKIKISNSNSDTLYKPQFSLSKNAKAYLNDSIQISGVTKIRFPATLNYKIVAENGTESNWQIEVSKISASGGSDILTFTLLGQIGETKIETSNKKIVINISDTTLNRAIVANYTLSDGATAKVGIIPQVSGVNINDFSTEKEYTITAQDGTSSVWRIEIIGGTNIAKNELLKFDFMSHTALSKEILRDKKIVIIKLDQSIDLTNLVADFQLSPYASAKIKEQNIISKVSSFNYRDTIDFVITSYTGENSNWKIVVNGGGYTEKSDKKSDLDIKLYPTLSNGLITLEVNEFTARTVILDIYNIYGSKVHSSEYSNSNNRINIDLRHLMKGVYIGHIITELGNKEIKIIIK